MITVSNLSKAYGDVTALRDVSFEIKPGQVVGYLGPNGAGKSTTVRILTGTSAPTSGTVTVAGFDVTTKGLEVKRRVGYVPETANLYSTLGVNEFLALVGALHELEPEAIARRGQQMLESFGVGDIGEKRIDTLSKGMRQKVLITSALMHDPQVILLDEPLSGLDANAVQIVKQTMRGLADAGKTVFYSSHMLDVVEKVCDHVIILDQGQVVARGAPTELMSMSQRDSLASVFRGLTSGERHDEDAGNILDAMRDLPIKKGR